MTFNKLLSSEVKIIDMPPSALPAALENNQVDAIVIWEPHAYNAQKLLGDRSIRLPSSEVYRETFNFMVMNNFAKDRPKMIGKFLKAIDKATTFIKSNKDASQAIVVKRLNLDKEIVTALWDDFVFVMALDQSLLVTLEDEARWAIKNKLTDKTQMPNYLNFIYVDALEAVKPEAVTIIR